MRREETAQEMFEAGQRRWPSVELERASFVRHCERIFGSETSAVTLEEAARHAADVYLCCACIDGNAAALQVFDRECSPVARAAVARIHHNPDFVQETVQELWDKLLVGPRPKALEYSGRGPLQAWVRVAAARMALDRCRAQRVVATRRADLGDELASEALSPELSLTRARHGDAFREALRRALAALSKQDRNVLRMHVLGRCSIDQIGRAYQVHRATAARWLEHARTRIYDHTRRELSVQNTRLTESEFKSLARAIGSELDLSLAGSSVSTAAQSKD